MASTSFSSIRKSFKYDVFLSFRGEDTRNTFVGHLYQALKEKGIETYKDDEKTEQGKKINYQLMRSIQESRFFIIVFSKTYASSSWCLDELVKIMECQKTAEQTAYPVFFDVEPIQVRKQSGPVKEAFSEHERKEAAGKWREAMKEASGLAGWELKKIVNGDESKLIQIIVDKIFGNMCSISSSIDGNLIGMEMRKREVLSSLDIGTNDVRVIGIKGIGGGGKTTLARAVYDQISTHFEGKSFVENVREVAKTPLSGLKTLQEQILRDVFDDRNISISGVSDGKKMMIQMMPRKKVLVVLDDVDHRKQLEALIDNFDNFKSGSRIIITTRDEQVLLSHGVCLICNVKLLTDQEAVCLFSRYAFGKEIPNQGFNEMSGQVVRYAAGLPLTIKVLGSSLRGKSELEWKDALERLKKVPEHETQEILKLSYDALEDDYKEIFLDVACILKGEQKDKAIRVLESCGFHGTIGLRVLEQKCLINISQSGSLGMHDLIEEMGKNVVLRSNPNEPNRDSRLLIEEKNEDILDNDLVNETIRCVKLWQSELKFDTVMRGLGNMRKLRVLYMSSGANWNDSKVRQCFPDSLQYLSWRSYPFLTLHETFQADNLVGLDMSFSSIVQIWEWGKRKGLNKLRFLDLSYSNLTTLNLEVTPKLEILNLEHCTDLEELYIPNGCPKLKVLKLDGSGLRTLDLGLTPNLERLEFKDCSNLVDINAPDGCLEKLVYLDLSGCGRFKSFLFDKQSKPLKVGSLSELHLIGESINMCPLHPKNTLPKFMFTCFYNEDPAASSFGNLKKLISIGLCSCTNLESFSRSIYSLQCLEKLTLEGSIPEVSKDVQQLLDGFPVSIFKLKRLIYIHLLNCTPDDLPKELRYVHFHSGTLNIKMLILEGYNYLVDLHLQAESLNLEYLEFNYSKLKTLKLANTPNLEKLILKGCNYLVELQMPKESLKLKYLNLRYSKLKTIQLRNTPNLEELILEGCKDLVELQMPEESLKLKYLELRHSKLKTIQLRNTPNLKTLILEGCNDLVEFQMPAESMNLQNLYLSHSKLKTIQLGNTPYLEKLILEGCNDMVGLQMPNESLKLKDLDLSHSKLKTIQLGNTPNLEKLLLIGCNDLIELQMPAESLKLAVLHSSHSKLTKLHLGNTPNLEELILDGCNDLVEFQMPAESLNLQHLNLSHSKLKTIQLGNTLNLKKLILQGCNDLVEFQMPDKCLWLKDLDLSHSKLKTIQLGNTPYLEKLILKGCNDLVEFQMPDKCLWLKGLDLSHSKLKTIQLGNTPYLEKLILKGCNDLEELRMPLESPGLLVINLSHSKLRTLHLGRTPKLRWLSLENCCDLVEINAPNGSLFSIVLLALSGCGRFKVFRFDQQLNLNHSKKQLTDSLSELHLIAKTIDVCQLHPDNSFPKFRFECYYDEAPALSFGNLEMLISMGLCACTNLEKFSRSICSLRGLRKLTLEGSIPEVPRDLHQLECLEELIFSSSNIRNLPDSICKLKHLNSLKLKSCLLLEKLPDDLGRIESLETLTITDCSLLRDIPKNAGKIKCVVSPKRNILSQFKKQQK